MLIGKNVDVNFIDFKGNRMDVISFRSYSVVLESKNEVILNMKRLESGIGINCFLDKWYVF